jgi:hypothetical protein
MAKSKINSGEQEVIDFLNDLIHPLKKEIEEIRKIILKADKNLTEHIKWNAPSFCIDDEDCVTMNLTPKNIRIIFHRGAKVKTQPKQALITDSTGLLKWAANDRAIATFANMEEIKSRKKELETIVTKWIEAVN